MYSIQLPSGDLLEGDFNLQFDLNNQVLTSTDASALPGSFSLPADCPLTNTNKILLGNPHLVTNVRNIQPILNVTVKCYDVPLLIGTLKIISANPQKVSFSIIINAVSQIKETQLNALDLGGVRTIGNQAAMLAHAKATTTAPLDYDYIFFPVYNTAFLQDPGNGASKKQFQNWWNVATQAFEVDDSSPAFMPFVRLEYLLERIFAGVDYTFQNQFQTTDELKQIAIYNNYSLWTEDNLPTDINLINHVSKTKSTDFLKKLMSTFCLGLFTNIFNRTLRLIPLEQIINRQPLHDWTAYVIGEPTLTNEDGEVPAALCYQVQSDDAAFEHYAQFKLPTNVLGTLDTFADLASHVGTYYITRRHAYYNRTSGGRYFFKYQTLGCAPNETDTPRLETELVPLWDIFLFGEGYQAPGRFDLLPRIDQPGTVEYQDGVDEDGQPIIVKQAFDVPDRFTIYRGLAPDFDLNDYPLASGLPWDGKGNPTGDISLRWDKEKGMYTTWWGTWHNMLRNGKAVTQSLALPLPELLAFSFEDKVRIGNMDYFVKKLTISKPLGNSLVQVEASLISVV